MEERMQDMDRLVDKLAATEKKRRRNALYYLALPVVAGVFLIFWTGWQAETLETKTVQLEQEQTKSLDLQVEVHKARKATEFIRDGLAEYHAGNDSAAVRLYDKAIELDSLNPVVLELKSELLWEKGEKEKASKILNKAVEIDSVQQKERTDILHYVPKAGDKLKAIQRMERLKELKADSQNVIRRKLKAEELKGR